MDLDPWSDGRELDDAQVELNLTPLVDVVFALLIVFMVASAAYVDDGRSDAAGGQIDLALPAGSARSQQAPSGEVVVALDADGSIFQDGKPTDTSTLAADVVRRLAAQPELQVRIEADRKLTYERVMDVIAELQRLGVRNVGLATRAPSAATP